MDTQLAEVIPVTSNGADKRETSVPRRLMDNDYWLTDNDINEGLKLIAKQWNHVSIQDCLLTYTGPAFAPTKSKHFCQVIHMPQASHWIAATNLGTSTPYEIRVFDSLGLALPQATQKAIASKWCYGMELSSFLAIFA